MDEANKICEEMLKKSDFSKLMGDKCPSGDQKIKSCRELNKGVEGLINEGTTNSESKIKNNKFYRKQIPKCFELLEKHKKYFGHCCDERAGKLSAVVIGGIVVGSITVLLVVVGIIYFLKYRK